VELARRLATVELAPRLAVALVGSLAAELAGRLAAVELTPSLAAELAGRLAAAEMARSKKPCQNDGGKREIARGTDTRDGSSAESYAEGGGISKS